MQDLVSFIVVSWNRYDDLIETIHNLNKQKNISYEIVVVDNNSDDERYKTIKDEDNVVYIKEKENRDRWIAANDGFKASKGNYIVTLDDDSFPSKTSISKAVKRLNNDSKLGIIAMDIYDYDIYYGKDITPNKDFKGKDKLAFIACAGIFRRKLLSEIGMWEHLQTAPVEISFSIRVLNAGYTIKQFSDIYVYHKLSQVSRPTHRRFKLGADDGFRFYWTYDDKIKNTYNILKQYVVNDYLRGDWYGVKSYFKVMKERPKKYKLMKHIKKLIKFNPQTEGKHILDYNEVKIDKNIKSILLIRTRPMQLLRKTIDVLSRRYPNADIELLTHPTTSDLFEGINVNYYNRNSHFYYDKLTTSQKNTFKKFDMLALMGNNYKLLGGYENIQIMAKKLDKPLVGVSPDGNVYEYTKKDLTQVRIGYIISFILTPILLGIRIFFSGLRRATYYWDYLDDDRSNNVKIF